MTRLARITVTAALALGLAGAWAAPAHAETLTVGQCYQMSDEQLAAAAFPDVTPVECTSAHNSEIVLAGTVPVGQDAGAYAQDQCNSLTVNDAMRINRPRKGVVVNPILLGAYNFTDGTTWQCVSGFLSYRGAKPDGTQARTLAVQDTSMAVALRTPAAHRTCLVSKKVPTGPWVSTSCTRTGIWYMTGYMTSRQAGNYPGQDALNSEAGRRCPRGTTSATYSSKATWSKDWPNYIFCFKKF